MPSRREHSTSSFPRKRESRDHASHPEVETFLAQLQVERRMSAHTLDAYRRDLDALSAWAASQGTDIVALHTEQLRAFVASEHRRGLSPKSLQRLLSACRSLSVNSADDNP